MKRVRNRRGRHRVRATAIALAALLVIAGSVPAAAYSRPGRTIRVSVGADGVQANNGSQRPSISADGSAITFQSYASDLVSDDANDASDVFVRDVKTGATERVSVAADGTEGNSGSFYPSISPDGRHVAFDSSSSNLVPGDTNGWGDVFVHDRETGITERVSVATDGSQGNGGSFLSSGVSISGDGRYVVFTSRASNLVPGDTPADDVFVHDRQTGTTERVSATPGGLEANGASERPSISADGRHVAFRSLASDLVPEDGNGTWDVFVRDLETGGTERVSVRSDGGEANGESGSGGLSADGRHVAFDSFAPNLVPGDTNRGSDVFVHDRQTGTTERVSVTWRGAEANGGGWSHAISGDGRHVVFNSWATNVVPGDTNGISDLFVRDRQTGATDRVSLRSDGGQGNAAGNRNGSDMPAVSADGRYVAFFSESSNLVPGDSNGTWDVFRRDRGPATGIGGLSAALDGDRIDVSGWATFAGARVAEGSDAVDDAASIGPLGGGELGAELTGASLSYLPEQGDLQVVLRLTSLPGAAVQRCLSGPVFFGCAGEGTGAGLPAVLYGLELEVGGERYEVRAIRAAATTDPPETPHFALYRCDPDCTEQAGLTGGIGTTGNDVVVSVPLSALGAQEDAIVTGIRAFTALGEASPGAMTALDEVDLPAAPIPSRSVSLGIAPAGTPESQIAFDTDADLTDGDFSGAVDVASVSPGTYDVWARGCLADVCGAAFQPLPVG